MKYCAMVTGCAEGWGLQLLAEDLGWKAEVRVSIASRVAKAVGNRRGLGKLSHAGLWVQHVVKEGRLKLKTVKGTEHVADHWFKCKSTVTTSSSAVDQFLMFATRRTRIVDRGPSRPVNKPITSVLVTPILQPCCCISTCQPGTSYTHEVAVVLPTARR